MHCLWEYPKSKDWLEKCLVFNENESYKIDSTIKYVLESNNAPLDHILLFTKFLYGKPGSIVKNLIYVHTKVTSNIGFYQKEMLK